MWDTLLAKNIQRELTALDPGLFLDKEFFEGAVFPIVRYREGEMVYNVTTAPYLTMDLVTQVKLNEGTIKSAIEQVKLNNQMKKAKVSEDFVKNLEEVAGEHDRSTGKIRRWFISGTKPIQ